MEDQYDEPSVKTLEYVESAQVRRLLDSEFIGFEIIGNTLNLGCSNGGIE